MIVFLLLVIIAILLIGSGPILRFGAGVMKVGLALLAITILLGSIGAIPGVGWIIIAGTCAAVMVLAAVGWAVLSATARRDGELLRSPEGQALIAKGEKADDVVRALRGAKRA